MPKPATNRDGKPLDSKLKVVDTYIRAIERLSRLVPEVTALESEVASREAEVLGKILALLGPVLPKLVGPVTLREPWLDGSQKGTPRTLKEPGVVVERTFSQHREAPGTHIHRSLLVVINERGRLALVNETAQWTEPQRSDIRWEVESNEIEITPAFAAEHLRGVLAGILDVLRVRLARDLEGKRDLRDRLERLDEAERALG